MKCTYLKVVIGSLLAVEHCYCIADNHYQYQQHGEDSKREFSCESMRQSFLLLFIILKLLQKEMLAE